MKNDALRLSCGDQLELFEKAVAAPGIEPASPPWAAEHWPNYSRRRIDAEPSCRNDPDRRPPAASALVLWAESLDLPIGARRVLIALAREATVKRSCRMSLSTLASASGGMGRNTCKRHLEKLLTAGLVMMKPWTGAGDYDDLVLGYQFKLIVDEAYDKEAAIAVGFEPNRAVVRG